MNKIPVLLGGSTQSKPKFDIDTVKQCLDVLQKRYMGDNNREDQEVRRCIDDIKNYFGVKS